MKGREAGGSFGQGIKVRLQEHVHLDEFHKNYCLFSNEFIKSMRFSNSATPENRDLVLLDSQ